jgi:hypothetical protein
MPVSQEVLYAEEGFLIDSFTEIRPRILMLAALFALFPLMLSWIPLIGTIKEQAFLGAAVCCLIIALGVGGLVLAFRNGSLLLLCLYWVVLLGVAVWMYPNVGPENDELASSLYAAGCVYLIAGLGLTLAARPFSFRQAPG